MAITAISAASRTDRGRRRSENEDAVLCITAEGDAAGVFAIADGMGGQNAGEVASAIAIATLRDDLGPLLVDSADGPDANDLPLTAHLHAAIVRCNERILLHAQEHPETRGLGATMTVVVLKGSLAIIGNVGDSRTYRIRQGAIESLTHDHSLVAQLAAMGQIEPDEIYTHPQRNFVLRALGAEEEVNPDIFTERLQSGDTLLLCSDGLWGMVRDDGIYETLSKAPSVEEAAMRLIDLANQAGGDDNISVVIVAAS